MTPNPETKLLACPFCGAVESERDGVIGTEHKDECYLILMETELPNSPLRIMAWNTRTTPQPPVEVKDLEKVAEKWATKMQPQVQQYHTVLAMQYCEIKSGIKLAITESTAPLLRKIEELEILYQNRGTLIADQFIEIQTLKSKIAVKDGALKEFIAFAKDYLTSGGLFNPEMAIHDNVRDVIIKFRDTFQSAFTTDGSELGERTRGLEAANNELFKIKQRTV